MKKGVFNWRSYIMAICVAFALMASVQSANAYIVNFEMLMPDTIEIDQTFSVDIYGTYNGSDNVLGGAIDLLFDSSLVQATSTTLMAAHDVGSREGTIENNNGMVSTIGFASFGGITGTYLHATVDFLATGVGDVLFDVRDSQDLIYSWYNEAAEVVLITSTPASLTVTSTAAPVPIPAAIWLVGSGFAGLVAIRRKIK